MGWTVNTYAGTRATGQPSNYRLCMYDLIRAIEQRMRLRYPNGYRPYSWPPFWQTQTIDPQWWSGDNTLVSNIQIDDLYMLRSTGASGGAFGQPYSNASKNTAYKNMVMITRALLALLGNNASGFPSDTSGSINWWSNMWTNGAPGGFVTEPGGNTFYTKESLEDAIGSEIKYPERVNEARWWQSIQDALDKLIYVRTVLAPIQFFGQYNTSNEFPFSYFLTQTEKQDRFEESWDERSYSSSNLALYNGVGISVGYGLVIKEMPPVTVLGVPIPVDAYVSQSCTSAYSTFPTSFVSGCGDIVSAKVSYIKLWGGIGRASGFIYRVRSHAPVSATINGHVVTSTTDQSDTSIHYAPIDVGDGSSNTNVDLVIQGVPPDSNPFLFGDTFGSTYGHGRAGNTGISIGHMLVYTDASSVLDDQN